jgi:ketosteroid isomerase-like protein
MIAGCGEARHDEGRAKAAVIAANAAKDEAMIARDAARFARFYTEDYLLIDDDAGVHGKDDQVRFMTQNVELLRA